MLIDKYRRLLADHGVGIAGIEFIVDGSGEIHTYDINTNTNYNPAAEAEASSTVPLPLSMMPPE